MEFENLKPPTEEEKPRPLTAEEKQKTRSRMASDAELMDIKDDLTLEVSKEMVEEARLEMENEKGHYLDTINVNGIEINVGWDERDRAYTIYLPQIALGKEATMRGVGDQVIIISKDSENAKKVFVFAAQEAKNEGDVYELYKKVENFINSLPNEGE